MSIKITDTNDTDRVMLMTKSHQITGNLQYVDKISLFLLNISHLLEGEDKSAFETISVRDPLSCIYLKNVGIAHIAAALLCPSTSLPLSFTCN